MADYIRSLMRGVPTAMTSTTQVFALPPSLNYIHSTLALELSVDGTTYVLTAATTTGTATAASFCRCTTATTGFVVIRRY